jgi:Tfp pilus assembly protein PilF
MMIGRWSIWLVLAAAVLVYANSLGNPFVFDDATIVEDRSAGRLAPVLRDSPAAGRPVVRLTLAANHARGGKDVRGYRAVNIALHLACTLMLFAVLRRTFGRFDGPIGAAADGLAAAVALLWTLHPLHSECINYISQRSETIMALFYLLTLYGSIRALEAANKRPWYVLAVAACVAGMASKEAMVTAPVMVVLYDAVFSGRSWRALLRERGGFYAALAATWLVLGALIATGPRAASVGFSLGTGAPYALVLVALLAATAVLLVRRPRSGFALVWLFVILAPTSSVVPIITEVGAERRMYLALAGPLALITVAVWLTLRRRNAGRFAVVLLALVAALLAGGTLLRNRDYRSATSIWQTAVSARPENHRAHGNLGKALQQQGRPNEALTHYRRALALKPDYAEGLNNLGSAFQVLGQTDEAIASFHRAIEVRPGYVNAHYNLATALQSTRRLEEAVIQYRRALELTPGHARAHNNLGTALGSQGKLDEALVHFHEALRLDPDYVEARKNLELALSRSGRTDHGAATD